MSVPQVSIVIPTFNRADLIMDTVMSVLNQSYLNIEVIVVSDGGTDQTARVLQSIEDKRLNFIRIPINSGLPAVARNIGVMESKGEYIAFCDDDDVWLPKKLEKQLDEFKKDANLWGVSTNMFLFPERKLNSFLLLKDKSISYRSLLNYGSIVATSTVLLKKQALDVVGLFDESPLLRGYEDWDLWLRVLKHRDRSIKLLRSGWVKYRVNNSKLTLSEDFELAREKNALGYIYIKHLPLTEIQLEALGDEQVFKSMHNIAKISRQLYFGVLQPRDIMVNSTLSFRRRCRIIGKYYLKQAYFFWNSRGII